jgi:hypothetical protein
MGVRWLIKNQQLRNKKLKGQIKLLTVLLYHVLLNRAAAAY